MTLFSQFDLLLRDCLKNIHRFSREIMHFVPTKQQEELFKTVQFETFAPVNQTKKGIFVASGNGTGKTAATSVVACFRAMQRPKSLVMVTAPTRRQVEDVWMGEFGRNLAKTPYEFQRYFDVQRTKVTIERVDKWGIVTATSNRPENVQGYHESNLTIIADEASGVQRKIWEALKGTMTQESNLLIGIGNPNNRDNEFFDAFNKDIDLYHTHIWSSEDSPNVDRKQIKRMEEEYGRDSDVYRVRVLGLFPRESPNVVVRYEDLLFACRKQRFGEMFGLWTKAEAKVVRQVGIDLARFGSDESVIVVRMNSAEVGKKFFSKTEPADVIRFAFEWQRQLGWSDEQTCYCVDAGGMGQGVMHLFYENKKRVHEFHSQGTPFDRARFKDAISEAYWNLRDLAWAKSIYLKEDSVCFSQLTSRQYRYDKGLIRLESKDEYMKRVGTEEYTSPDRADATALAFYPYATEGIQTFGIEGP